MKKIALLIICITSLLNGMEKKDPNQPDPNRINHLIRLPQKIQDRIAFFLSFPGEETDQEFIERMETYKNGEQPVHVKVRNRVLSGQLKGKSITFGSYEIPICTSGCNCNIAVSQNGKRIAHIDYTSPRRLCINVKSLKQGLFGIKEKVEACGSFGIPYSDLGTILPSDRSCVIEVLEKRGYREVGNQMAKLPLHVAVSNSLRCALVYKEEIILLNPTSENKVEKFLNIPSRFMEHETVYSQDISDNPDQFEAVDFNAQSTKLGVRVCKQKKDSEDDSKDDDSDNESEVKIFELEPNIPQTLARWLKEHGFCKNLKCSDLQ